MSTTTKNLGLIKPELSDIADITAMNENWDKLDEHCGTLTTFNKVKVGNKTIVADGKTDILEFAANGKVSLKADEENDKIIIESNIDVLETKEVEGKVLAMPDSANSPFASLSVFGETTQDGVPTPEAPIDLVSVGNNGSFEIGVYDSKNLFNEQSLVKDLGSNYVKWENGQIHFVNSTGTAFSSNIETIKLPVGTYYLTMSVTESENTSYIGIIRLNGSTSYIEGGTLTLYIKEPTSFTFQLTTQSQNTVCDYKCNIKLCYETDYDYEPCNKQTLTVPYKLPSVNEFKNEVNFNKGVQIQRVLNITANDITKITRILYQGAYRYTIECETLKAKGYKSKSNITYSNLFQNSTDVLDNNGTDKVIATYAGTVNLYLRYDAITTENELLQFLKDNNFECNIILAEQIEIPLSEVELNDYRQLKTNKGNTTVLSEANMKANYVVDSETAEYVEQRFNLLNEQDQNLQTQIDDMQVTDTVTGSAITIESSQAPLQNLKLYGKTTQDGTPTPTEPKELKSVGDSGSYNVDLYGKNMLEFIATTQTIKGVTFTVNADKSITVNGTPTENIYYLVALIRNETLRSNFILKGGVAGSFDTCIFYIASYNETGIEVDGNADYLGNGVKLNLKGSIGNVNILVKAGHTVNTTFYPILCHESLINTPYEPYKAKQTLINTDTLRGIGDIADEKDFARGVQTQRFSIVDLGTLNWNEQEAYKGVFLAQISGMSQKWSKGICSCYPFGDEIFTWSKAHACADDTLYRSDNDYVYIKDLSFPDATTFKSAMYGKLFIYPLETPIETPISESELNAYRQLYTNKGTTTILSEADMEVDYYINKPNAQAIGNIHSIVNADYLKIQQAIITAGGSSL